MELLEAVKAEAESDKMIIQQAALLGQSLTQRVAELEDENEELRRSNAAFDQVGRTLDAQRSDDDFEAGGLRARSCRPSSFDCDAPVCRDTPQEAKAKNSRDEDLLEELAAQERENDALKRALVALHEHCDALESRARARTASSCTEREVEAVGSGARGGGMRAQESHSEDGDEASCAQRLLAHATCERDEAVRRVAELEARLAYQGEEHARTVAALRRENGALRERLLGLQRVVEEVSRSKADETKLLGDLLASRLQRSATASNGMDFSGVAGRTFLSDELEEVWKASTMPTGVDEAQGPKKALRGAAARRVNLEQERFRLNRIATQG